jgi:transposase-like protein
MNSDEPDDPPRRWYRGRLGKPLNPKKKHRLHQYSVEKKEDIMKNQLHKYRTRAEAATEFNVHPSAFSKWARALAIVNLVSQLELNQQTIVLSTECKVFIENA